MRPTESYSAVLVEEGGPLSRLQDVREVLKTQGLFRSRSTDRGSHDWLTVGGTVDTSRPTQGPRAWQQLGGRAVRRIRRRRGAGRRAADRCDRKNRTDLGLHTPDKLTCDLQRPERHNSPSVTFVTIIQ